MSENKIGKIVSRTWNPFTGCTKISPACKNCYAETFAIKLNKWGTAGYENKFDFTIHYDRIEKAIPLKRKKPTFYFINSMSDTFHEQAKDSDIDKIMDIVEKASWHNFYILTKRSARMRDYFNKRNVPDNCWIGVTVEDKKYGLSRIKDLQAIKAKNKHLCCEPLLEDLGAFNLDQISLIIAGGESGNKARRAKLSWVESLQNQCKIQNVHFFWKQWGSYDQEGNYSGKAKTGYLINGKVAQSIPENFMPSSNKRKTNNEQTIKLF